MNENAFMFSHCIKFHQIIHDSDDTTASMHKQVLAKRISWAIKHPMPDSVKPTGSALAAASDIHRQMPTYMADIRRDWLTDQNTDCCFVVIGLVGRQSHSPLLQLKIDPVRQMGPPYWLAPRGCQRIFINIRGQYGIQKNIYIHPWLSHHL